MATKDLIKKMTSSQDVKPNQLLKPLKNLSQVTVTEVSVVKLDTNQTVENKVQEELENIEKSKETPDRSYFELKINRLQKEISEINERLSDICQNMELLFEQHNALNKSIETAQQEAKKPKSFLERLIKWR